MKCAIEVGKPDWRPLENAIPPEYCEDFMYMGKAGDIVLYKHRLTRRYLNIDAVTGKFYRYANDEYVEIDRRQALRFCLRPRPMRRSEANGTRASTRSFFWAAPARTRRSTSCARAQSSTCRSPPANVTGTSTVTGRNTRSGTTWSASSGSARSCAITFARDRGSISKARCGRAPGTTGRPASAGIARRSSSPRSASCRLRPMAAVTMWSTTSAGRDLRRPSSARNRRSRRRRCLTDPNSKCG